MLDTATVTHPEPMNRTLAELIRQTAEMSEVFAGECDDFRRMLDADGDLCALHLTRAGRRLREVAADLSAVLAIRGH